MYRSYEPYRYEKSWFESWFDSIGPPHVIIGAAVIAIGMAFLIRWCLGSHDVQAQVVELKWRHTIDLRERREWHDADWGHAPSTDGYFHEPTWGESCVSRQRTTICASRTAKGVCVLWIPVYDNWCSYKYWEWVAIEAVFFEGTHTDDGDGHSTSWPTYGNRLDENHRETHRPGKYNVTFASGDRKKKWRYETSSLARYNEFNINDLWILEIPNIGSMEPKKKSSYEQN